MFWLFDYYPCLTGTCGTLPLCQLSSASAKSWPNLVIGFIWNWLRLHDWFISTEGAPRLPTTYDNHPIHPSLRPSVWHIALNELNRPWMIWVDLRWPPMTTNNYQWLLIDYQWLPMTINDYPGLDVFSHSRQPPTTQFDIFFFYTLVLSAAFFSKRIAVCFPAVCGILQVFVSEVDRT